MEANIRFEDERTGNRFTVSACSGVGKRENQQDSAYLYVNDTLVYAVVCDGMGGLEGGAQASAAAVLSAQETLKQQLEAQETSPNWMADGILHADSAVFSLKNKAGESLGAGSTFVSAYITGDQMFWASVGDSRIYLFHGHECVQITTDLNYSLVLQAQRTAGEISETEYQREMTIGEALTSFVGMGCVEVIDRNLKPLHVKRGDIILLCSDGLYRTIDVDWMNDILSICSSLDEACETIREIITAQDKPAQDNFTCIIIRIN